MNFVDGVHVSQQQPYYGATRSTAGNENGYAVLYTVKWRYYSGNAGVGSMCGFCNRKKHVPVRRFVFFTVCRCLGRCRRVVVKNSSGRIVGYAYHTASTTGSSQPASCKTIVVRDITRLFSVFFVHLRRTYVPVHIMSRWVARRTSHAETTERLRDSCAYAGEFNSYSGELLAACCARSGATHSDI